MKTLKKELFDCLIYIVDIKEDNLYTVIDKMIIPLILMRVPKKRKNHKNELCNANADGWNACRQETLNKLL